MNQQLKTNNQKPYIPDRGDIVWLSFNPQAGHEQSGYRPALTLSPKKYNDASNLALFCPITKQIKGYPFEVLLTLESKINGCILVDQIKSLDWRSRQAKLLDKLPKNILVEVLEKLGVILVLDK
jgi:mRNA interferase MazF